MTSGSKIYGDLFVPGKSRKIKAELHFTGSSMVFLIWKGEKTLLNVNSLEVSSRIGNTPRYIKFSNGFMMEVKDSERHDIDVLDKNLKRVNYQKHTHYAYTLEKSFKIILPSLLIIAASVFLIMNYLIPFFAEEVAKRIPQNINIVAQEQVMTMLDNGFFKPSGLNNKTKKRVRLQMDKVKAFSGDDRIELIFRDGGQVGPNAFALPAGSIVVTDQMVRIATNNELQAVFAHEAGHIKNHHSMRMALQSSVAALVIIYFTGDFTSSSTLVSSIPPIIIQNGYSRGFEREADEYAAEYFRKNKMAYHYLSDILRKIDKEGSKSKDSDMFSTHPATYDRIKFFEKYEKNNR